MENMEKRALLAVVLCMGILFVWQSKFMKRPTPAPEEQVRAQSETETEVSEAGNGEPTPRRFTYTKEQASANEEEAVIETELYKAVFSSHGGALKSWKLKKYKDKVGDDSKFIEMVTNDRPALYPFSLHLSFPEFEDRKGFEYRLTIEDSEHLQFVYDSDIIKIVRDYEFDQKTYTVLNTTKIWYHGKRTKGDVYVGVSEGFPQDGKKSLILAPYSDVRNFIYHSQDNTKRKKLSKVEQDEEIAQVMQWAGIENRYFVSALINRSGIKPYVTLSKPIPGTGTIDLKYPYYRERGKEHFELKTLGYFGPKVVSILKTVEPGFEEAVDFGMFSVICIPLLKTMNFFFKYVKNYGLAILLLTLLIRVIFHPLTTKSLKSMKEMQRIQPQIAKIKEKLKDDRQEMNRQVMALMKTNKVNPLGGCLPLLFQMPIFFALYRVLYNAIELYQAPFFLWIKDLSAKDPYFVTPILMGIAMFLQQKFTPAATADPIQQKMMMMMPLIFSFFMIPLPSGLVIYILFSTLLQVASQWMVNRDLAKKGL